VGRRRPASRADDAVMEETAGLVSSSVNRGAGLLNKVQAEAAVRGVRVRVRGALEGVRVHAHEERLRET
jgi:hypothetical protein